MKVECEVQHTVLENERGAKVKGVRVRCGRCERTEESYGRSDGSVRRCLALLRENCPKAEENYYVPGDGGPPSPESTLL